MRILSVPDLHIGKGTTIGKDPVGIGLNSRVEDQFKLLDYVGGLVKEYKVDKLVLLGDVFNSTNPRSSFIYWFFDWIGKLLSETQASISILMGNHCFVRSGQDKLSILDSLNSLELPRCEFIKDIRLEQKKDVDIVYVPFTDRKQLECSTIDEATALLSKQIKSVNLHGKTKILFGHFALEDSIYVGDEIDDSANEIFCPLQTFNNFDYVWIGHIHNFQVMKEKPHIAHLGSLDKTSFGEGDKYVALLDTEEHWHKYFKLPGRNLNDIVIEIPENCKDSTKYVCDELSRYNQKLLKDSIVRLKIEIKSVDAERVDKERVMQVLDSANVFHVPIFGEIRQLETIALKTTEVDETIDHTKAAEVFVSLMEADDAFKADVNNLCSLVIKKFTKELL